MNPEGNYDPNLRRLLRAGISPDVIRQAGGAGQFLGDYIGKAGQVASNLPVGSLGLTGAAIAPTGKAYLPRNFCEDSLAPCKGLRKVAL